MDFEQVEFIQRKRWVFGNDGLSPATEKATVQMRPPNGKSFGISESEDEQKEVLQHQDNVADSTQSP